jgi:hypothetical protein
MTNIFDIFSWLVLEATTYLGLTSAIADLWQLQSWTGKALETVNRCAFLKRRLIGAC